MRSSASSSSLVQLNSVTSRQSLRHWIPLTLILLATSKPVIEPFWINLPYSHIFRSIMPDVLHQLYQGVLKHLIGWITTAIGAAEVDAQCRQTVKCPQITTFATFSRAYPASSVSLAMNMIRCAGFFLVLSLMPRS